MTKNQTRESGRAPATKGDIEELAIATNRAIKKEVAFLRGDMDEMRSDMDEMRGDMDDMRSDMDEMRGDINDIRATMATKAQLATVLEVVQSIDHRLKGVGDIKARFERIERRVFA